MPNDFAPGPVPAASAPLFTGTALLDAEKLDAYRVALEFQALAGQLVPKRGCSELRDQLERASISIVLNTAEAPDRWPPYLRDTRRYVLYLAIDDDLLEEALRMGGRRTKRETVNEALAEYVQRRKRRHFAKLFGTVDFRPDWDYKKARRRS